MKNLGLLVLLFLPWVASGQSLIDEGSLKALLAKDKAAVVLDVRTAEEFASGHLAGAKLLPYDAIDATSAAHAIPSKTAAVVVYCRSGRRSALAAQTLKGLGYTNVRDFGGVSNWTGRLETGAPR